MCCALSGVTTVGEWGVCSVVYRVGRTVDHYVKAMVS